MNVLRTVVLGLALAALLAACGGSNTGGPATGPGDGPAATPAATAIGNPDVAGLPSTAAGAIGAPGGTDVVPPQGANPSPPALEPTAPPIPTQVPQSTPGPTPEPNVPEASSTSWRVYSARIYYDEGGGGDLSNVITTQLELTGGGSWYFSSSSGTWYTAAISDEDWQRWGVAPYGPSSKIVLNGWNGGQADGPIEESGGAVDFIWVIYPTEPPDVSAPGAVWMKFGAP